MNGNTLFSQMGYLYGKPVRNDNCFLLIAFWKLLLFADCFLLIAFLCLLFVSCCVLFAHFIFYFLSIAFFHDLTRILTAHRNFAMHNYISMDNDVSFHIMESGSAMLIVG